MDIGRIVVDYNVNIKKTGKLYKIDSITLTENEIIELVKAKVKEDWNADWNVNEVINEDSFRISEVIIS